MTDGVHLTIELVSADGKPLLPKANANTFVSQCRVIVRDNLPINIREWNKPAKVDGVSLLNDRCKDML